MRLNEHFIIIWTDSVPVEDGLADAARAHAGQLLAAGPVQDVSELDSRPAPARPAPAGLVIARFGAAESARAWLAAIDHKIDGTALLVAGATEPVWWPPERDTQRPEWSRRANFPPDRLGQFVCVWVDPITDREQFFDYSVHYRGSPELLVIRLLWCARERHRSQALRPFGAAKRLHLRPRAPLVAGPRQVPVAIKRTSPKGRESHYRWTVEHAGGVVLVPGPRPSQAVLRGGPGPGAMALMAWPAGGHTRRAWYEGSYYRPYREQRHRASRTSNISVRALALDHARAFVGATSDV
jgi:hypothetical protein